MRDAASSQPNYNSDEDLTRGLVLTLPLTPTLPLTLTSHLSPPNLTLTLTLLTAHRSPLTSHLSPSPSPSPSSLNPYPDPNPNSNQHLAGGDLDQRQVAPLAGTTHIVLAPHTCPTMVPTALLLPAATTLLLPQPYCRRHPTATSLLPGPNPTPNLLAGQAPWPEEAQRDLDHSSARPEGEP